MTRRLQTVYDLFFSVPLIQSNGVDLPRRSVINFVGGAVDNPDEERTDVPLGGGSGGGTNTVHNGAGVPSGAIGTNGDFYIRTSNWTIYGPKTAGAWGAPTAMLGASGPSGLNGLNGNTVHNGTGVPSSGLGSNGDFYIDLSNHDLYGPKTAGAWGSPTSLVGADGPAGPAGAPPTVAGTGFPTVLGGTWETTATANIRYAGGKLQTDGNIQWKNGAIFGDLAWSPTSSHKTITLPNATGTVVLRDTADTLTTKTINVANNTLTATSINWGDILYCGDGATFQRLARGTSGQVLTAQSGTIQWSNIFASQIAGLPGSNTQLMINNSGALGATANWGYSGGGLVGNASAFISFGTTPAATGLVRLPDSSAVVAKGANGTDYSQLSWSSYLTTLGLVAGAAVTLDQSSGDAKIYSSSTVGIAVTSGAIQNARPRHGLSSAYASEGFVPITGNAGSGTALIASQFSRKALGFDGLAQGTWDLPVPANNDAAYRKLVAASMWTGGAGGSLTLRVGSVTWSPPRDGKWREILIVPGGIEEVQ